MKDSINKDKAKKDKFLLGKELPSNKTIGTSTKTRESTPLLIEKSINSQFDVEIKESEVEVKNEIIIEEESNKLATIFEAIEEGFSTNISSTQFDFPHPRNWVGPRFMAIWVIPIFLIKITLKVKSSLNPIRPYKDSKYFITKSETIYTSTKNALEDYGSMRFFGARFLTIWVLPLAITGIFMEYLFVSPITGTQPFG